MINKICNHCNQHMSGTLCGEYYENDHWPHCKWKNKKWWQFWIRESYR